MKDDEGGRGVSQEVTKITRYFGHGDKQPNDQPGEPRASLLVEQ